MNTNTASGIDTTNDDSPITERTRAIVAAQLAHTAELQNVTETVRKIQEMLTDDARKKEGQWRALIRSIKQFLSLID